MSDVERVAEVLAGHQDEGFHVGRKQGAGWYCSCGEAYAGNERYSPAVFATHLAHALAPLLAEVRAEALTEETCWQACDADCERGSTHCLGDHLPAHKAAALLHTSRCVARRVREAAEEGERRGGVKALREAADAIQALHPGEVKNSVIFLRARAAALASGRGAVGEDSEGAGS